MTIQRRCIFVVIGFLLTTTSSPAFQAGNTGLAFLKMGAGAKAIGMGEAVVAISNDATSAYWNPSGLLENNTTVINFTHNQWFQDVRNEFLSFAFPWGEQFLALSISYNSIGSIEYRTGPSSEPLASVSAHDLAFGLSYARPLSANVSVGTSIKYIHEKIYLDSASGAAIDVGMKFDPNIADINFGLTLRNIGYMGKMRNERINLPTILQVGTAWIKSLESVVNNITIAADYMTEKFEAHYLHLGAEIILQKMFALRIGYQVGYDNKDISAGVGFMIDRYAVNYSYVPYKRDLGNVQRFSLTVKL